MVAVVTNVVICASSVALFLYWFRYSCMLILAAKTSYDHSEEVASTNQLVFPEVRARLQEQPAANLNSLHRCLERDYVLINYLLEHTPASGGESRTEVAMLKLHYRVMSAWYRLTWRFLRESASEALEEMLLVVVHLANVIGERAPVAAAGRV